MTTGARPWTRRLADPGDGLAELGGKGVSLARMAAAGLPVPDGFHITTGAYEAFLAEHDLQGRIAALVAGEDPDASETLSALFVDHDLPEEISRAILTAYAELGEGPVAVRSSATAEDLPEMSFAGQQESFLNVRGVDELLTAVRTCWASLWTPRAVDYRRRADIDETSIAVVVQRLVDADAAGVMFTADPLTGALDRVQINAGPGLGEAVVSGQVTPDSYVVEAATGRVLESQIHEKMIMTVRVDGGTTEQPVPAARRSQPTLSDDQAAALAALGQQVSDLSGGPMDIEWALDDGRFALLQARPITTGADLDPWNDARDQVAAWTNTNVGEAIPDVMTPATWWLVQAFLEEAMATAATHLYRAFGRIGGRIYLNLSLLMSLSGAVGVSEKQFRRMTEEVFGRIPDDVAIPRVRVDRFTVMRTVLPVGLRVAVHAKRDMRSFPRYVADHPARCERLRQQIAEVADPSALGAFWGETLEPEFRRAGRMLSAATRNSGTSFVGIRRRLRRLVGEADANALTAGQGEQHGSLASLGLLVGLEKVAEGSIDHETFNRTYGHRGPHEFEVSLPRPAEDLGWVDRQIAQGATSDVSAGALLSRQQAAAVAARARLQHDHPLAARVFGPQIDHWTRLSHERELARSEVVRFFWVMRDYLLRAGELTGLGQDIFFLDLDETAAVLAGADVDHQLITVRREAYQRYRSLPSPPPFISGRFDLITWAANADRRADVYVEGTSRPVGATVSGFAGSAGVVVGVARLIEDIADGNALQPGEILITGITNVGWTPLFPVAAAVVTDVGAPLSHAAIVARELGIPAVVGCGNATTLINTGDRVRVDGSAGTVELLDRGHQTGDVHA